MHLHVWAYSSLWDISVYLNGLIFFRVARNRQKHIDILIACVEALLSSSTAMLQRRNRKLIFNFFSLGLVQGVSSLLQLVVLPYTISKIGVDSFGVIAVVQVVLFFLATFNDYGFNQTATRGIALNSDKEVLVSSVFFRTLVAKSILCITAFVILVIVILTIPFFSQHALMCLLGFTFVVGQSFFVNWFFQGLEKMHFIAVATLIGRLLFAALVFIFIKEKNDDVYYLFFLGIGHIVTAVISIFLAFWVIKLIPQWPSRIELVGELIGGWQIMIANLSIYTCQYANIFVLRYFTNDLVTGYYSIAERVFFTLKQALVIFSQSAYPAVCKLIDQGRKRLFSFFRNIFIPFFLIVAVCGVVLFIFSSDIILFFSGYENPEATLLLRMFCVVLLVVCMNIPFTLMLLAMDKKSSYFKVYMTASLLNILLNIPLCYFFQSTGTVIAILATELFITAGVAIEVYRHYQKESSVAKSTELQHE